MFARLLADAVVAVHGTFILFVTAGGFLVLWRRSLALVHVPAVAWGAWTEFTSTVCPLTPLETTLRRIAGDAGYTGGFVEHYLIPLIYPPGLTPRLQVELGSLVLTVNLAIYGFVFWRTRQRGRDPPTA
jgi:hypothetical protein